MGKRETGTARSRRTEDALLTATREMMETCPIDDITMAAVAERANVSRRAVYLHFASRTELFTALFRHVNESEDLVGRMAAVGDAEGAEATLRAFAAFLVEYIPRVLAVSEAVHRASANDPGAARHWESAMRHRREHCDLVISRVEAERRLAPEWTGPAARDLLLAMVSNDVVMTLLTDCGWSPRQARKRLGDLFVRTFLRDA